MLCLFFILLFLTSISGLCPDGSYEWQTKCYIFQTDSAEFFDAETKCITMEGHLASVHDAFTNAFLTEHLNATANFWIGLSNLLTIKNFTWNDASKFDFSNWNTNQPGIITNNLCGTINTNNGGWVVESCSKGKPFVCDIPPVPPKCSGNFTYFEPTNSCYGVFAYYYETGMNFTDGENFCKSLGGHLPSLHSREEYDYVFGITPVSYLSNVPYSGLFTNDWGSSWEWTDGSPVDFLYWKPNYPDLTNPKPTTCASLTDTGLENFDCTAANAIVCKINLNPQTTLHPPTTTAPKCSGNFSYFEATNSCYGLFYGNYDYGLTWDDSENVCKTFNGHLASIHSHEEYRYVYGISFYSYRSGTWAGLFSNNRGNTWSWSDGSPVDYIYWQPDAPYRNMQRECGIMEYNGFLDTDCTRHATFVCKIEL